MAYRLEGKDIVIYGFEKGIAPTPFDGLSDMRDVNIISVPNEASVNFGTTGVTLPPTNLGTINFQVNSVSIDYLVIGGGGGGGGSFGRYGGGGGAGDMKTGSSNVYLGAYTITIGAGGAGGSGTGAGAGVTGGTSSIGVLVSSTGGGGGGQGVAGAGTASDGVTGGSGGGGGNAESPGGTPGAGAAGTGTNVHSGATPVGPAGDSGGGGGAGFNASGATGGNGLASSISGASVTYAGGGGAPGSGGAGGTGGGGTGGIINGATATAGTANTGSGGGGNAMTGASNRAGAAGGSGVVVISYPTGNLTATGGTITTSGGNTIHTFTTTGTFTVTAIPGETADEITTNSTTGFVQGMAVHIVSSSVGGVTADTYCYVGSITATTFKLYASPSLVTALTVTSAGSGTMTVVTFAGIPVDRCETSSPTFNQEGQNYKYVFIVDDDGLIWYLGNGAQGTLNQLYWVGNSSHSTAGTSQNIVAWKGYLFGIFDTQIDYIRLSTFFSTGPAAWSYAWKGVDASSVGHKAIAASDDAVYICNGTFVASIVEVAGETFDPTSSGTFTYNDAALDLPSYDYATCLAELGTDLLIGGIKNAVYPWNRVAPSFDLPILLPEEYTARIVSTNSNAYVFAGRRGYIYLTNGSSVQQFKKFPDHLAGVPNPYYTWWDAVYKNNQLYFSLTAKTNGSVAIDTFSGMWAIDTTTEALRLELSLSSGTYAGTVRVLIGMGNPNPLGLGMYIGWDTGGTTGHIDFSKGTPYIAYEPYIISDYIPVGLYYSQHTFEYIEYKLSRPLVTGESLRFSARANLTDSFVTVWTSTTTGQLSDTSETINFENNQWLQMKVEYASTATTPSHIPLKEFRIR